MGKLKGNAKGLTRDRIKNKIRAQLKASSKVKNHLKSLCSKSSRMKAGMNIKSDSAIKSLFIGIALCSALCADAQWRIVLDPKAVAQIEANTAMQLATENAHNAQLDSVLSKQKEILEKSAAIAAAKELTLQTLQNIEGFGTESVYYKQIARTSKEIAELSPKIMTSLKNSGIENKALVTLKVSDLVGKATQCVNDFVSIVSNSKISNPVSSKTGKNDGHNLLDRYERMTLACQIYGDLLKIKRQLDYMLTACESGTWADLINAIDHRGWAKLQAGKIISQNLINQWNKTVK